MCVCACVYIYPHIHTYIHTHRLNIIFTILNYTDLPSEFLFLNQILKSSLKQLSLLHVHLLLIPLGFHNPPIHHILLLFHLLNVLLHNPIYPDFFLYSRSPFFTHLAYVQVSLLPVMLSYAHDCQGPDSAVTLSLQALTLWFVNVILKLNIQVHTATADKTAQIVNAVRKKYQRNQILLWAWIITIRTFSLTMWPRSDQLSDHSYDPSLNPHT